MAMASVSCVAALIEPKLIAPVTNRFIMSSAGSTSLMGMGSHFLNLSRLLNVAG
jgi:hypothetical protein